MATVADVSAFLYEFAPLRLAEAWDNAGLLVGDPRRGVERLMTCLTITADAAAEAIAQRADMIVVHHPLPFTALKRITTETPEGRLIWDLIGARISIYSPHTAFDSAPDGINQRLATGLELADVEPLITVTEDVDGMRLGAGRFGRLDPPLPLESLAQRVKQFLNIPHLQLVGRSEGHVHKVAVACGSGGSLLAAARDLECDCFVTGEARFHTTLEAEAMGLAMILTGHFASERFGVEGLAERLAAEFPHVRVWASRQEGDPLRWI